MAKAFSTSQEVINQTVTAYLVMQGACKQSLFKAYCGSTSRIVQTEFFCCGHHFAKNDSR